MRHAVRPDFSIFEITGGAPPAPGEPLFLRVASRLHDQHTALPVSVERVTDTRGERLPLKVHGETPALLETRAAPGLTVHTSSPRATSLTLPPAPAAPPAGTGVTPSPRFAWTSPTRIGDHHIDLIPVGGELVAGLENRVILRLLDASRRPLSNTRVTLTHSAVQNGRVTLETDRDGLAELRLLADRPNLDVAATFLERRHTLALRPLGRELTLEVPPLAPPGGRLRVDVRTLRTRGLLSCELMRGEVWLHALDHPITTSRFELEVPLPELAPGTRLDLQCALVPGVGLAWASRPIWLGAPSESLSDLLAQTVEAAPRLAPRTLLKTRDTDRAHFEAAHAETRTLLFVALICVFAALLLLALSRIILHTRRTRAQLNAALSEDPTLTGPERRDITRTRGLFYLLVGLSLALGWVTAVAALLA